MSDTKKKGIDLPQTKGNFQVRGRVSGTLKDNFYVEKLTKTNKPWRSASFGVEFDPGSTIYVGLNGMERDAVYFSKRDDETKKTVTKSVPWKDRFTFKEDGYRLIGVNLGIEKVKDEKGKEVNNKKTLTDYDAAKEISDHLVDDKTVFVKGRIEYGSYNDSHTTKFVPSQISLAKDIDFEAEEFAPLADFTQTIVFISVTPNDEKTKATVEAKIVNYDSIEDAEFFIEDMSLAKMFNKNLKPYTSIKVWGNISVKKDTSEVETTDCWGKKNNMDRVNTPTVRELIITGADPDTIDTNTYSEEEIDRAIEAIKASREAENDFGGSANGTWGSVHVGSEDDDNAGW